MRVVLFVVCALLGQSAFAIRRGDDAKICKPYRLSLGSGRNPILLSAGQPLKVNVVYEDERDYYVKVSFFDAAGIEITGILDGYAVRTLNYPCPVDSNGHSGSTGSQAGHQSEGSLPAITSPAPVVGEGSPGYDPQKSAYDPDGTLSRERVLHNETIHGVPYDSNNLQEQMVYCTLNRC